MIRIIIINLQKKLIGQLPINFKNLYIYTYAFIYDGNIYILEFSYNFIYLFIYLISLNIYLVINYK